MHRYIAWNGPMPTTAGFASVTTGTTIKSMLQIATPSTRMIWVEEWGYTVDDPPGADSIFELVQTDVAATVTAHVASGVQPLDPNLPASLMTLSTSGTGYTATVEGAIAATRSLDMVSMSSVSAEASPFLTYRKKFDVWPAIPISKFLRVRATTPTSAVDMRCWIVWHE
jgi:hypothetical protein